LILGCDGVWDEIEDQEAVDLVRSDSSLYKSSIKLRDNAFLLGSDDNISAVLVNLR